MELEMKRMGYRLLFIVYQYTYVSKWCDRVGWWFINLLKLFHVDLINNKFIYLGKPNLFSPNLNPNIFLKIIIIPTLPSKRFIFNVAFL